MIPQEIIRKKRDGGTLSTDDIREFWNAYRDGAVEDYQMSAMLMAIVLRGMKQQETADLTSVMHHSGKTLSWDVPSELICDKHSTGGVGDKTSLIILPICVLEGLYVPMMAGRGLGHTGGTVDKLESIPGFNPALEFAAAKKIMQRLGGVFLVQTKDIAPLDRKIYALRDVTATVESIPLITASILSKKLAEGMNHLVMDIKFGTGAFLQDVNDSEALARSIREVATAAGVKVRCALTSMNTPLGDRAGNALEIMEVVEVLQGRGPKETRALSVALAVEMILLARPNAKASEVEKNLLAHLDSGRAFERFCQIIAEQGGDVSYLQNLDRFPRATEVIDVVADQTGYVSKIDVRALGLGIVELGGGRKTMQQPIDPAVGLSNLKQLGDRVQKGDLLARIHSNRAQVNEAVKAMIKNAYQIGSEAVKDKQILKWI